MAPRIISKLLTTAAAKENMPSLSWRGVEFHGPGGVLCWGGSSLAEEKTLPLSSALDSHPACPPPTYRRTICPCPSTCT